MRVDRQQRLDQRASCSAKRAPRLRRPRRLRRRPGFRRRPGRPYRSRLPARALAPDPARLERRLRAPGRAAADRRARGGAAFGEGEALEFPSTSHISIVDRYGDAVAMTTTIEDAFGSKLMTAGGFLLNNELTDFTFAPFESGRPVANRVEGGKRPRSSMAPTIVYDAQGRVTVVAGSPGGPAIINYVAKTLIAILDWGLDPQAAIDSAQRGQPQRSDRARAGHQRGGAGAEAAGARRGNADRRPEQRPAGHRARGRSLARRRRFAPRRDGAR